MLLKLYYGYMALLLLLTLIMGSTWRRAKSGTKILTVLVATGLLTEVLALYSARTYGTNALVYAVSTVVQTCLIYSYILNIAEVKAKKWTAFLMAVPLLMGIWSLTKLWPPELGEDGFMYFSTISIISLCLFALLSIANKMKHEQRLATHLSFCMCMLLLLYEVSTFRTWMPYTYLAEQSLANSDALQTYLLLINILTYAVLGLLLFFLPAKKYAYGY